MARPGRKPLTDTERRRLLLADPVSQVLLGDPDYAAQVLASREVAVDWAGLRSDPDLTPDARAALAEVTR